MTVSTHVYAAGVQGAPVRVLSVRGGSVTLDDAAAPHVQAAVDVAVPSLATLAALDPRLSPPPRVTVTADVTTPWGTLTRSFDLTVRRRRVRHKDGVVELSLSSDEGLLEDFRPLADDEYPYRVGTSLRAVVNYVLAKAIPGAVLEAVPAIDADVTPYTDSVNYVTNPAAGASTAGWSNSGITVDRRPNSTWFQNPTQTAFRLYGIANNAATFIDHSVANASQLAGKTVLVRGRVRTGTALANPSGDASRLRVYYSLNNGASYVTGPSLVPAAAVGATADVAFLATLPSGVTNILVRAYHGWQSTDWVLWSDFRVSEYRGDPGDVGPLTGDMPASAGYAFAWTGTAHLSTTTRTALISRSTDMLRWLAGDDALGFLSPIVQAVGYRLVCDERRKWTLRNEAYEADGALQVRHAVNLIDADDDMNRESDTWCDAAVVIYTWLDATGTQQRAVDSYALTATPTRVVRIERSTPFPGPGFAAYIVRRAQGRGREVSAVTVADWSARSEQPIQIVLEGAPTQIGKTSRVVFDLDRDEVTVTTRTTDTPPSAWALIPTGQRWIDSPAGASWTSEAI